MFTLTKTFVVEFMFYPSKFLKDYKKLCNMSIENITRNLI